MTKKQIEDNFFKIKSELKSSNWYSSYKIRANYKSSLDSFNERELDLPKTKKSWKDLRMKRIQKY